jgi:hypothetical protein
MDLRFGRQTVLTWVPFTRTAFLFLLQNGKAPGRGKNNDAGSQKRKKPKRKMHVMTNLTQADIESITDEEYTYGTTRFLPPVQAIPDPFWGWFKGYERDVYFRIAEAMYVGEPAPIGEVSFNPGFNGKGMQRFLKAHLHSVQPEYQHKMAGLAFLISMIVTITEIETKE